MMPKFRAFYKANQKMYEVLTLDIIDEKTLIENNENPESPLRGYVKITEVELMQSTGLKDKNGLEIYEGDIVRYTWDLPNDVNTTEKGKKIRVSKVFWSDWRASFAVGKNSVNSYLFRYVRNGNTVEVIGNIYENPELLGDKYD